MASGSRSGSLAEGQTTNENVQADDEGTIRASATWTDGTKVQSQTFGPASLGATATATHTVSVTATDAPITGSLTWAAATKSISISDSAPALGTTTHDLVVNTTGVIQATMTWPSGLQNLDLELLDPTGAVVAESKALTGTSETVEYTVPAGGTGTYTLRVTSLSAQSSSYSISGSHPFYSNLNLELRNPANQVVATAAASGSAQPEQISYTPPAGGTGTYSFRVTSADHSTPSYTLSTTRPVTARATLRLRLFNPAAAEVASSLTGGSSISVSSRAPDPGGGYRVELTNTSADIEVPSHTLHWKTPESDRAANLDLELRNAVGAVVASSAGTQGRTEQLAYPGAAHGAYTLRVIARTYDANYRLDYGIPKAQEETTTYNARGEVATVSTLDGPGPITHTYDRAGRLTQAALPDGTVERYAYDAAGRTTQIVDSTGTQSFTYNAAGQPATATDQAGVATTYTYDAAGNENSVSRQGDAAFSFVHDAQNRFAERVDGPARTTVAYGDKVFPTRLTHQSGEVDERAFRPTGEVDSLDLRPVSGAAPTLSLEHSYDLQGNLTQVRDDTDGTPETVGAYLYDRADRLAQETFKLNGGDVTYRYTYDAQGNRTSKVASEGTTTYSYNPGGQLVASDGPEGKKSYFYDERGNLVREVSASGATAYAWTPDNRLASVSKPDGTVVSFDYDAEGRRTRKTVAATVTAYAYENGRLASLTAGAETATFTYDDAGAPLTITTGGKTYAYRYDERGSVIELTDTATDQAAATYQYDAWGRIVEQTGPQALRDANPYAFAGAHGIIWDRETELYLMGARYYDPDTGRFLSADPAAAHPEESTYVYTSNNPVTRLDPSGLDSCWYYDNGKCQYGCKRGEHQAAGGKCKKKKKKKLGPYRLPWKGGQSYRLTCGPYCNKHNTRTGNYISADLFATDWSLARGDRVQTVRAGYVEAYGTNSAVGKWIAIRHGDGLRSVYLHFQNLYRSVQSRGRYLKRGTVMGTSSGTKKDGCGACTGPHLHIHFLQPSSGGRWESVKPPFAEVSGRCWTAEEPCDERRFKSKNR